jgi:NAD(P)-dependent dehydrogenase (short-subunit alcohol dehydrogenase family)
LVDRNESLLSELRQSDSSGRLFTFVCDVTSYDDCLASIRCAHEQFGSIDVFIYAVGINPRQYIEDISLSDWDSVMNVNLRSCFWLAQIVSANMKNSGGGKMVFFSSVSGVLAHPQHGAYAASKGAMNQMLRVMAIEWANKGIRVNAVGPGYAETPLTKKYLSLPGKKEEMVKKVPMGRLATPEDVVGPVLFLSSSKSDYVTGQILLVDGGRTLD